MMGSGLRITISIAPETWGWMTKTAEDFLKLCASRGVKAPAEIREALDDMYRAHVDQVRAEAIAVRQSWDQA